MKIGIDARFLTHPQPGGFKTYTENLIAALAKLDTENEYVLYLDRDPYPGCKLPSNPNFKSKVVPGLFPLIGMPFREQVDLVLQIKKDRVDLFHSPCMTAPLIRVCPLVVTIHDMIWAFPERFSKRPSRSVKRNLMGLYNRVIPKYAASRASAIITVSNAAKKSIVDSLPVRAEQVLVTHEAASPAFKIVNDVNRIEAIRQKYALHSNFILAIGSADPRKNIHTLVQAYALLSQELQEKYQLAIVWTHSSLASKLSNQIERLELLKKVRFLFNVSTDDLVLLYNAASLFVFPSLYEGFGLPLLEAMACGVPIIAANNSSIPEIMYDAGLLFSAQDALEISNVMGRVLNDPVIRQELIDQGLRRSTEFSWLKCAQQTLNLYNQIFCRTNGKTLEQV